jgi:hypothetical protein
MLLGSFLTIAVEVALVVQGVTAVTDLIGRQTSSSPAPRVEGEPADPADLGLQGTKRDYWLQKCGTAEEKTNPELAALCSSQRASDEIDERNARRAERERSGN